MNCWHETVAPAAFTGNWVFHIRDSRVAAVFRERGDVSVWQGYFLRYEGSAERPQRWEREPEDWFELWPHEPIVAQSFGQAKAIILPWLGPVADGSLDDKFEKRPYRPSKRLRRVKVVEHPLFHARAMILEHPGSRFEVRYFVCLPEEEGLPILTPSVGAAGWEWGRVGEETATYTDDLGLAEKVATDELNHLVSKTENIRRRHGKTAS